MEKSAFPSKKVKKANGDFEKKFLCQVRKSDTAGPKLLLANPNSTLTPVTKLYFIKFM